MLYQLIATLMLGGDLVWWRWAHRRLRGGWRGLLAVFVALQMFYMLRMLLWPYVPRHDSNPVNVACMAGAYVWHLMVLPFTLLVIGMRRLVTVGFAKAQASWGPVCKAGSETTGVEADACAGVRLHRREILVAVPPLVAGVALGYAMGELHRFRVRRMQVPLRGLPAALDGMTIAQVCDTHIGRFTDDVQLQHIAAAANALDADLTLFIGDLIDIALADLPVALDFAKKLRGRYGVYFCEGNHDLIEDATNETDVFRTTTRNAGLAMLFDETATVRVRDVPIQLVGGKWSRNSASRTRNTTALMRQVDPAVFSIFLSHHPHGWDESITPLTLAGHTHGGQLMINERLGVGPLFFKYWSGSYRRGDQALVVCNGTGNWYPVRIHAPAEIMHLTLRCA